MVKITKSNYKKFSKSNLLPNSDGSKPNSDAANNLFVQNQALLDSFKRDYDSLSKLRDNRARCVRYFFGDQLSDPIPNPDGCESITEGAYFKAQGITPMSMNIMQEPITNIISLFRRANLGPLAISRDRNKPILGEQMTMALEYAYQNQQIAQVNADGFREFMLGGLPAFRVGYDRDDELEMEDVRVVLCDINRMAWDNNTTGLYFENITRIGYLHDMPLCKVLSRWAHSKAEKERITYIYKQCESIHSDSNQQHQQDERKRQLSFYHPIDSSHCRVIEIWTRESFDCYACHDTIQGDSYTVSLEDEQSLIAENNRRRMEMVEAGGSADEAPLIEYEYHVEEKWIVRYLTPNGYVLYQSLTPYWHGSHPFVIGGYPLVDGEVHSVAERLINIQRVFNSTFMRNNFIRMNQAKGFGVVNLKVLERSGVTPEEFAAKYTKPGAIMALNWEDGEEVFKTFNDTAGNLIDEKIMQQCIELMDKISGNTGAIRGETPKSGTPSSLYAQQVENSATNMEDIVGWYKGLILKRDYKVMSVIQQYYQGRRPLNVVGRNYSEESKVYDSEEVKKSKFDLVLIERTTTGVKQLDEESVLDKLTNLGVLPPEIILEFSSDPIAHQILERIKAQNQAQADQLAQQQAGNPASADGQPLPQQQTV